MSKTQSVVIVQVPETTEPTGAGSAGRSCG